MQNSIKTIRSVISQVKKILGCKSKKSKESMPECQFPPASTTWKETTTYTPLVSCGRVIKVYDGDTITIAVYNESIIGGTLVGETRQSTPTIYRFPVRLLGIDCPEKRTKNPTEKKISLLAQAAVSDLILGEIVDLTNVSMDKYGRLLANVKCKNQDISQMLIDKRMAVKYDGGTKISPACWERYYERGDLK
jgi:endonuclease YncB( thermonuclease family)